MVASKPLALIIEDDPSSGEALALVLRDWGAEVLHSPSADTVVHFAPRFGDLRWIITDFHLGDGPDGVSVVEEVKPSAPEARVLVLSASFHGRGARAAKEAGYEFMQKPARAETIVAWLERA
jgi:DNA-binding NtrC family response regulator